jgi:hypothetical protein
MSNVGGSATDADRPRLRLVPPNRGIDEEVRVDYEAAKARSFAPPSDPGRTIPAVTRAAPARRLRDAIEPIGAHAFWVRAVHDHGAELGLQFHGTYLRGRAASLGEVPSSVVVAAFGVFAPRFVTETYESARARSDRAEILRVREAGTVASLNAILGEPRGLSRVVRVLRRGLAEAHTAGRPLFAGLSAQPWPDDPVGQLWRACELLREHRGDGHLAVCIAAGLDPIEMNLLTELYCGMPLGSYAATRRWTDPEIASAAERLQDRGLVAGDELTAAGHQFRGELERRTDRTQAGIIDALGADLDPMVGQLDNWSQAVIEAEGFPPGPSKRAAG